MIRYLAPLPEDADAEVNAAAFAAVEERTYLLFTSGPALRGVNRVSVDGTTYVAVYFDTPISDAAFTAWVDSLDGAQDSALFGRKFIIAAATAVTAAAVAVSQILL